MLGKLIMLGAGFALAIGLMVYWAGEREAPLVEATNIPGGEVVTRSETDAEFRIFKSRGDVNRTVETTATIVNRDLRGTEKNAGAAIARDATQTLQTLTQDYQDLAQLNVENPCPSLEDWEAAGGVPGGTEPNPPEYPLCDPDVLYDPARCTLFWADLDPDVDHPILVGEPRETQISRVGFVTIIWNGVTYNLRIADPSSNPDNFPNNC